MVIFPLLLEILGFLLIVAAVALVFQPLALALFGCGCIAYANNISRNGRKKS